MNATPLPVAEFVPSAPGSAPASPGTAPVADLPTPADGRTGATFAALLQSAEFAADPLGPEESVEAQRAETSEDVAESAAPGSALDGLLFLAHVQATAPASPGTPAQANGTPPPAEAASASAARLVALASQRGVENSNPALVPPAGDSETPPLAGASATVPLVGRPLGDGARPPAREALPFDSDPVGSASSKPAGEPAAAKSDPMSAFALPSLEVAKRPAVEALGAETKPLAAASSPDPAASIAGSANPSSLTLGPVIVDIDTPVTDPAWRGEVAGRMVNLVTRGFERAELRLSPAEMGPVEVRIDMRGGEATLAIVATQATTRDALEQALPLLREMLAQQGLSLGEATVRDGRADDQANGKDRAAPRAEIDTRPEAIGTDTLSAPRPGLIRRLVDVFA